MTSACARVVAVLLAGSVPHICCSGDTGQRRAGAALRAAAELGVPFESAFVDAAGVRLRVVQAGPAGGPPVVLLHGMPEFWWGWRHQIPGLAAAGLRVIVPDQRGYDESDKPAGIEPYQMKHLAADVAALIAALGHDSVYLAGHDWGGIVAFQVAIRRPETVRKLAIFNSFHPLALVEAERTAAEERTVGWYRLLFQLPWLPERIARAGDWALLERLLRDSSQPGTFSDSDFEVYKETWARPGAIGAMLNWYRAYAPFRFPGQLEALGDGRVRPPARLVWGVPDAFMESRLARLSLAYCADAELIEMPGAGHWVLHTEAQASTRLLVDFFGAD
jgi:pimeloyl-ACP methyl ester carboxylesterase